MNTLSFNVSDETKAYIAERLHEGCFNSPDEFFTSLIRLDQELRAQERLEALLLEGLRSGPPIEITDDYKKAWREELRVRMQKEKEHAG